MQATAASSIEFLTFHKRHRHRRRRFMSCHDRSLAAAPSFTVTATTFGACLKSGLQCFSTFPQYHKSESVILLPLIPALWEYICTMQTSLKHALRDPACRTRERERGGGANEMSTMPSPLPRSLAHAIELNVFHPFCEMAEGKMPTSDGMGQWKRRRLSEEWRGVGLHERG